MAKYDVDDILAEVKRKRAAQQNTAGDLPTAAPAAAQPVRRTEPLRPAAAAQRPAPAAERPAVRETAIPKAPVAPAAPRETVIPKAPAAPAAPRAAAPVSDATIAFDLSRHSAAAPHTAAAISGATTAIPAVVPARQPMREPAPAAAPAAPVLPVEDSETIAGYEEARRRRIGAFRYDPQESGAPEAETAGIPRVIAPVLPEEDGEEEGPAVEYRTPEDAPVVRQWLRRSLTGLFLQLVVGLGCFGILLYLGIALDNINLSLPPFMHPETAMRSFLMVSVGFLAVQILFCHAAVGSGLAALFRGRANSDTLPALAVLFCLLQGMLLCVFPEKALQDGIHIYLPLASLALCFLTYGRLISMRRMVRCFKVVASDKEKHSISVLPDTQLAHQLVQGLDVESTNVVRGVRTGFLSHFVQRCREDDLPAQVSRIAAPVCLAGALVVGVISYVFDRDLLLAFSALTAILCITAPLASGLVGVLPMARLSKKLLRSGAAVTGWRAFEHLEEIGAVMLSEEDLFPQGNVELHGIKAFAQGQIDSAILDMASVVCRGSSPLRPIFLNMIGGNLSMLKPVEAVSFANGAGVTARVAGEEVLIGTAQLLRSHGIEPPSHDFEARYRTEGREVLYLASGGTLVAMFVLSYRPDEAVAEQLSMLERRDVALLVRTTDPNITPQKIAALYGYPIDLLRIIPAELSDACDAACAPCREAAAEAVYSGHVMGLLGVLYALPSVRQSITMGVVLNLAGTVIGYAMVTFFAFMGGLNSASFTALLIFQLFWGFAAMVVPNLRRL